MSLAALRIASNHRLSSFTICWFNTILASKFSLSFFKNETFSLSKSQCIFPKGTAWNIEIIDPMIEANCLIFGDLLTRNFLILRVRCSAFLLVHEIFIFLESIKNRRNSIFCVGIKTDLLVRIENPTLLSKSLLHLYYSYTHV